MSHRDQEQYRARTQGTASSLKSLVERAKDGDRNAFEQLATCGSFQRRDFSRGLLPNALFCRFRGSYTGYLHADIYEMTEQLNLNDEEKGALDELFLDNRRKLIDLKGTMERERLELENVFEKESLDEPAVMAQFKRLEDARANLATERFRFVIEVRKMIGYDRFQSLKAFFTRLCRERERHGGERSKLKKYDHGGHARQWNE